MTVFEICGSREIDESGPGWGWCKFKKKKVI